MSSGSHPLSPQPQIPSFSRLPSTNTIEFCFLSNKKLNTNLLLVREKYQSLGEEGLNNQNRPIRPNNEISNHEKTVCSGVNRGQLEETSHIFKRNHSKENKKYIPGLVDFHDVTPCCFFESAFSYSCLLLSFKGHPNILIRGNTAEERRRWV